MPEQNGQQLPPECQLTTDDLVLMIGEGVVKERQAQKINNFLQGQMAAANDMILEARSKEDGLKHAIEDMQKAHAEGSQSAESLRERIKQLEDQVHATALERDKAQKAEKEAHALVDGLRAEISGLMKQVDDLSRAETFRKKEGKKANA